MIAHSVISSRKDDSLPLLNPSLKTVEFTNYYGIALVGPIFPSSVMDPNANTVFQVRIRKIHGDPYTKKNSLFFIIKR